MFYAQLRWNFSRVDFEGEGPVYVYLKYFRRKLSLMKRVLYFCTTYRPRDKRTSGTEGKRCPPALPTLKQSNDKCGFPLEIVGHEWNRIMSVSYQCETGQLCATAEFLLPCCLNSFAAQLQIRSL